MKPEDQPVSSNSETPGPRLSLHTGRLDDRRETLDSSDRRYAIFARAYDCQDDWTDDEHRDFWTTHLPIWSGGRTGNRANRDALAFVLVLGRAQGNTYDEVISAIGHSRDDLRDRGVIERADRMWEASAGPAPTAAEDPRPWPQPTQREDGGWSIPGPGDPDVIRCTRLWRTPRVWVDDCDAREDDQTRDAALLPGPMQGRSTLPPDFGDVHAFAPIGDASLNAVRQGQVALERIRPRFQPPTRREDGTWSIPVAIDAELPYHAQRDLDRATRATRLGCDQPSD